MVESRSTVASVDASVALPSRTYRGTVATRDLSPLEPTRQVQSFYARGIGLVAQQTTEVLSRRAVAGPRTPALARPPVCRSRARPTSVREVTDAVQPSPIIYTHTDEAPLLATYSFLPIVQAYAGQAGVAVETRDISLAGRIIAQFPERLTDEQRLDDALAELGALAKRPEANIIKLPNVSASIPQLKAAIAELQSQGYDLPDYPDSPSGDEEKDARARYDKVKGSAVNPVLREGNSDRRAADSVKQYARKHPHSMGAWTPDSKTNVATMGEHDFKSNEKSVVLERDDTLRIEHEAADGTVTVLKESLPVLAGEIVDATVMQVAHLHAFVANAIARAKADDVLFSVHLKATMMKVSDPIIFGHVVTAFFPEVFATVRRAARGRGAQPHQRPRRHHGRSRRAWPTAPRSRPRSRTRSPPGPRWRWSTPTGASPTSTSRPT